MIMTAKVYGILTEGVRGSL